ncbi:7TM diverse intracellular signaling domain-containing protein [Robiginitalea sp. M366]|uniref:hybrid sensor histidine kinase/response regulator n=1 Tax=Robiginitalea aestuariiviva TaxID=3036903 RepID=UPI00240D220E|nr:hybrid sensor histidine kinase/response regulator [Robiginitalea aestuariiviva]MDG1572667.1 7TM diverse intracellular signaling domain-containing protein [Robiginitalea aestuariiviva]
MRYLILMCLLLTRFAGVAQADPYHPSEPRGSLYQFAQWAPAGDAHLSLEEAREEGRLRFRPLEGDNHALGFTDQYFWVRFQLANPEPYPKTYYLQTGRPVTDRAILYQTRGGRIKRMESGDQIPFSQRDVPHRATIFALQLPPHSESAFYLELKSDGETLNLPLELFESEDFWMENYRSQLFLGLFYGLLFLAGIIYLFFYSSLQEKSFLYYGMYVLSIFLMQATLDGLVFQYVFPEGGYLNDRFVLISALICNFYLLRYCEEFLRVRQHHPGLYKFYLGVYFVIGGLVASTFLGPDILPWVYPASNVNGLLSLMLILTSVGILRFRQQVHIDRYFATGICFLVVALMGFVLNNLSVLPNNFLILNSTKIGSGFEVLFLSLSMTNRIRDLRRQKEHSQELALQKSEEISQMKTSFMSNMSHELRTPLNLIMGIVQEGMNTSGDAAHRRELSMVRDASLSLLSSINDILDFEKIQAGTLRLRNDVFDPRVALEKMASHWGEQAQAKGLTFELKVEEGLPGHIRADKERLLQIANTVLSNAVKYTRKGCVCMDVGTRQTGPDTVELDLTVRDTGIGIAPEKMPQIFDSFSQMRLDDKRSYGGIGLGLCIARHLVEAFGGSIEMDSEVGVGTIVHIHLPVLPAEALGPRETGSAEAGETATPMRVLVVEDNKMNLMVIKKLLAKIPGIIPAFAGNGQEALQALEKESCDLILMDLQMPVMDGYEATQAIREGHCGPELATVPIVAVTADTTEAARDRVTEVGMQGYISKPVDLAILAEKVEYFRAAMPQPN